jgi:hypothetical protein
VQEVALLVELSFVTEFTRCCHGRMRFPLSQWKLNDCMHENGIEMHFEYAEGFISAHALT